MTTKTITYTEPHIDDCEFRVDCLPEISPIKGNVLASGDDEEDRKEEERVQSELDSGNEWAWCIVRVTCRWRGFEGTDTLGACSYADKRDFVNNSSYYDDMRGEAYDAMLREVDAAHNRLAD